MRVWIGTSGYSYAAWKGRFYPPKLPAAEMLGYYARRFHTVEVNATFYRMPSPGLIESWAAQVPADFRFAFKAPRRITHDRRLQAPADSQRLCEVLSILGPRLGPVLFQLPPSFAKDLGRLDAFIAVLPPGLRAAFEFRHRSWHDPEVHARLAARNCALCHADTDESEDPAPALTASWGYARLRRAFYSDETLAQWALRLQPAQWTEAYVYFKHEDEARGPEYAARFAALAGAALKAYE